jgi:hemoglobin
VSDPPPPASAPIDPDPFGRLYGRLGEAGFARLTAAFYRRVRTDDLLGPMYPEDDWDGAEQRLRDFLVQRFGGPPRYSQQRGHPRLRMRHAPFPITPAARDRWLELMDAAMEEAELPGDAAAMLRPFFTQVATFMINRPPHED